MGEICVTVRVGGPSERGVRPVRHSRPHRDTYIFLYGAFLVSTASTVYATQVIISSPMVTLSAIEL
jgi:hypothetical protein